MPKKPEPESLAQSRFWLLFDYLGNANSLESFPSGCFSIQIKIQRLQQILGFIFFRQLEKLAFQSRARSAAVAVIRKILFVLLALGFGRVFLEISPDVGCGIPSLSGVDFFGEGRVNEAVEFLDRIDLLVFQQRADGLIDRGRPLEDGVFIAAPLFL